MILKLFSSLKESMILELLSMPVFGSQEFRSFLLKQEVLPWVILNFAIL